MTATVVNIHPVDVKERVKRGEPLVIVDVREQAEVATGIIPLAMHIPLNELTHRWEEIPSSSEEIILVCRSGNRSSVACQFLSAMGYKNVKNMLGGMNAWDGELQR